MKTNLFSRITLAGLLLSAAVASNAAMAQGVDRPVGTPAVQHVSAHDHAQSGLLKTAHHRHHRRHHRHHPPR